MITPMTTPTIGLALTKRAECPSLCGGLTTGHAGSSRAWCRFRRRFGAISAVVASLAFASQVALPVRTAVAQTKSEAAAEQSRGEAATAEASAEDGKAASESPGGKAASQQQPKPSSAETTAKAKAGSDVAGVLDPNEPLPPGFVVNLEEKIRDPRKPPSADQLKAMAAMRRELRRFEGYSLQARQAMAAFLERDHIRRLHNHELQYTWQLEREERLQDKARARAIKLLEEFIARFPNDPERTPDAMFRLGELYFERSQLEFQQAVDAQQLDSSSSGPSLSTPDYSPTMATYEQLLMRFPSYDRVDGVYYLLGYCRGEMGQLEAALKAWRGLVCANQFPYFAEAQELSEASDEADLREAHPSLGLDRKARADEQLVDYRPCQPLIANPRFASETWFRIGEYHFDDYRASNSVDLATQAYQRIVADPNDRNYSLALYKLAWAYYRASRYPEAVRAFAELVSWSDTRRESTGEEGSQLRPEAIQYLAISFAYDDWNENQVPDPQEGGATALERVSNPNLMDQRLPWVVEVYLQLGTVLFEEVRYPEAIRVWQAAVERWPLYRKVPQTIDRIAMAHARYNEMASATAWRAKLAKYDQDSQWWKANERYPEDQREAKRLAENGIVGGALFHHEAAQSFRQRCFNEQNPELCQNALDEYAMAASLYAQYLEIYPNNPQAYELRYNLADALYWSEQYDAAAKQYAKVRDSNIDDRFLAEAARRAVEARKRIIDIQSDAGKFSAREQPPEPAGVPPSVALLSMPNLLQDVAHERELYIAKIPPEQDRERVLNAYDYNNALLLYRYGYWFNARKRFRRIFATHCKGPLADDTGRVAWLSMRNIAVAMRDTDEVERVGKLLQDKQCTFSASADALPALDCSKDENKDEPQCLAGSDLINVRYKRAVELFRQAEASSGADQVELYNRASILLVRAVNEEPDHPDAPLALEKAAIALERVNRFESASRLYQRIVDEVGPRKAADAEEQKRLDGILANAYFRLAYSANKFYDFERSLKNYAVLANSERFSKSEDESIQKKREDAVVNAAITLEWLQRYGEAAAYYKRAASTSDDPAVQQMANYKQAEMEFKKRNWSKTVTAMKSFIGRYSGKKEASSLVVLATWRIAQAKRNAKQRDADAALSDVTRAFARSGEAPGSESAEYAAEAAFLLADKGREEFESFELNIRTPRSLERYVKELAAEIDRGGRQAKQRVDAYSDVLPYKRPTWTIAAFVRQGRVYEVLARAVLNAPFKMPADLARQVRRLSPDQREDIRIQVEDRIRMTLDEKVRPIECRAVARYALAARAAKAGSLDNEYASVAVERLQAYGDERIAECIEETRKEDATFAPYQAGEFSRAPQGVDLPIRSGLVPRSSGLVPGASP